MEIGQQIASANLAEGEEATACEDSFAALVQRQSRFVFRVAYSVLRNAHDSEEVVQDTFLKIYRRRSWSNIGDEKAFLARTASRLAVDRLTTRNESRLSKEPSGDNPEQAAISAEWSASVQRFIEALPQKLRQPLALSSMDELNSREIAELMRIPEGTVRTRLMLARRIVRSKLAALLEAHDKR
jgi:RNA polymerase sigma-70 factor (ECF subfamily)